MKKILGIAILGLFLATCNNKTEEKNTSETNIEATEQNKVTENTSESTAMEGCFLEYRTKTCELISTEAVAQILGISAENISQEDNSKILSSSPQLIACTFSTDDVSIKVGEIDKIELGMFKLKYTHEYLPEDTYEIKYLEDLGESAAYVYKKDSKVTILNVYKKGNFFNVVIPGKQKSQEDNFELAKKIALEVLKKCS